MTYALSVFYAISVIYIRTWMYYIIRISTDLDMKAYAYVCMSHHVKFLIGTEYRTMGSPSKGVCVVGYVF